MARLLRLCPAGVPLHVVQRGNNRQVCFRWDKDYATYLAAARDGALAYGVEVHAWVLMTNHVHLLATPRVDGGISRMMQYIGRYYVRYFNRSYCRTGTLWEGRFRSCVVDNDDYFLCCQRYIELNPVRAGMVEGPGDYRWSSYHANALGKSDPLTVPGDVYLALGQCETSRHAAYRRLFEESDSSNMLDDLRKATNRGLAFGRERFKEEIQSSYRRRVRSEKPGPRSE